MPETPEVIVKEYSSAEYAVVQRALKEFHEREVKFLNNFDGGPEEGLDGDPEERLKRIEDELEWQARIAQQRLENFREDNSIIKIAWDLLNRA